MAFTANFNLPTTTVGGGATATEDGLEGAVNAELDRLYVDLIRSTEIFANRADAIARIPSLPPQVSRIIILSGIWGIEIRGRLAPAAPLFETGDPWGVLRDINPTGDARRIQNNEIDTLVRAFPGAALMEGMQPPLDTPAGTSAYSVIISQTPMPSLATLRRVVFAATRGNGTSGIVRVGAWANVGGSLVLQREAVLDASDFATGIVTLPDLFLGLEAGEFVGIDLTDFGTLRSGGSNGEAWTFWRGARGGAIPETDQTTARAQVNFRIFVDSMATRAYADAARDAAITAADTAAAARVTPVEAAASAAAAVADAVRLQSNARGDVQPGDPLVIAQDAVGLATAWVDELGLMHATLGIDAARQPGDSGVRVLTDKDGRVLMSISDGLDLPGLWRRPAQPGDPDVLMADADGRALLWIEGGAFRTAASANEDGPGGGVARAIPTAPGNAWMAVADGIGIRYLSDRYRGRVMGYEERAGVTLAETSTVAQGVLAYGGGGGVVRAVGEPWTWHVVNEALAHVGAHTGAEALAIATLSLRQAAWAETPTLLEITQSVGSPVGSDTAVGSALYNGLLSRLTTARNALDVWGKDLVVDRVDLSILGGAPATPRVTADYEYATLAQQLRADIANATGQASLPRLIVAPSGGLRADGSGTVALAESLLDENYPALGFVVTAPGHAYPLAAGSPGALSAVGAMLQTELKAMAMEVVHAGQGWAHPVLRSAVRAGTTITATFTAMSALVLNDPALHGFRLGGVTNGATITGVSVSGMTATITLSAAPTGTLTLSQAHGFAADRGDGYPANRSTLSDSWSRASLQLEGYLHRRYALPAVVPVTT